MQKSGEVIKTKHLKETTRQKVAAVMQPARSRAELERELKAKGIGVLFRQNDNGRIYGVTFIDHENRTVMNGSRLGKEFSANVFNDAFTHQQEIHIQSQKEFTPKEPTPQLSDSGISSAFGLFAGGNSEEDNKPLTQKKKKNRRSKRIN